jgi:DNA-binding Lrp family transcriptional regulator
VNSKSKTVYPTPVFGFFYAPEALFMMDLNPAEIAVYLCLLRYKNSKTYTCYPSFRTIGKAVGLSKKTVAKYVHSLEEKRLIITKHTHMNAKDGAVLNGTLLYHINPISWAVRYQNENKLRESERIQKRNKKPKRFAKRPA